MHVVLVTMFSATFKVIEKKNTISFFKSLTPNILIWLNPGLFDIEIVGQPCHLFFFNREREGVSVEKSFNEAKKRLKVTTTSFIFLGDLTLVPSIVVVNGAVFTFKTMEQKLRIDKDSIVYLATRQSSADLKLDYKMYDEKKRGFYISEIKKNNVYITFIKPTFLTNFNM